MNAKQVLLSFAVLATSTSAFAGDLDTNEQSEFVSTRTRAEVQAELAQAHAEGFRPGSIEVDEVKNVASAKSRDDVRKEAIQSARTRQSSHFYIGG